MMPIRELSGPPIAVNNLLWQHSCTRGAPSIL
jgi:hypothetical protein